ncbi:uncharacterized protein LOC120282432 isoform X2 [Dioscorea cayenensis subsp. rotundata]|uniref:Uncharacterized protein LOC120282432 isoform X2 n=1 Tax=Dioscorea cayennensis subsp. rotundata TaxID=55577 RepID=A0AB40D0I3_DIOCR|nr:uncharacterized protein LOC120282432 isoform X2 [Dioscorea cayenensis subsp. rotundata]
MEHDKKKVSMGKEMGENSSSSSVNQEKGKGLPVPPPPPPPPTIAQHPLDPKKLRRFSCMPACIHMLLNNRESSLRSRMKTEQRLKDAEQGVQSYTDQVNTMPIGIENAKNQIKLLRKENHDLKTKIFTLSSNRGSKEVEEIMIKKNIEELNPLLHFRDRNY